MQSRNKSIGRKIFKIIGWIFGILIGFPLVLFLIVYTYSKFTNNVDVNPSAYHWEREMSDADIEKTALDLISKMSIEEKVGQLTADKDNLPRFLSILLMEKRTGHIYAGGNERLDIPPISFSDGPRGIVVERGTCFPAGIARGATWNVDLERQVGDVIGKEARSGGVNYFAGLCINLLRHPANGRAQEAFGEDPWLVGEMALATMQGVQPHNVMVCAKHFALNSIENSRNFVNVKVDERTLREVYLPHFKKCADNGVASIMSAYNKVNGEYCGHNHHLLTSILRDEWGWKGFVTSDFVNGIYDGEKAANAGMDIEMPMAQDYGDKLVELIQLGKVSMEQIDKMLLRVLKAKLYYVTRNDLMEYTEDLIAAPEHLKLSETVAEESMVLLKNENQVLPFNKSSLKSIAVIGKLAKEEITGDKVYYVDSKNNISILAGLKNLLGDQVAIEYSSGEDIEEAKEMAKRSDALIIVSGYESSEEGENFHIGPLNMGGDRPSLELKERDLVLINALAGLNPKTVVSIVSGSAVIIENWKEKIPAILLSWYGGTQGGNAFANIIFGVANPSGKLPFSVAKKSDDYPYFSNTDEEIEYGYYHGYTLFNKKGIEPAYPFGFGMSYTAFHFDSLRISTPQINVTDSLHVSVNVTNTGKVSGKEVAQVYVGFSNSKIDRPVKLLRAFEKIDLTPGQMQTINFIIPVSDLSYYNADSKSWEIEGMTYEVYAGSSSASNDLLNGEFSVKK